MNLDKYINDIFKIEAQNEFEDLAIKAFNFQYKHNIIYSKYVDLLNIDPQSIKNIEQIPFLPIRFFKTHKIVTKYSNLSDDNFTIFKSSGTTQTIKSKHYVYCSALYEKSFINGFKQLVGKPKDYVILALLPSYLEAGNSSLVYMVDKLIKLSENNESGFYLNNYSALINKLVELKKSKKKIVLFGVTYALLELANIINDKFPELIIIETGGMKGRGTELTRSELHYVLKTKFGTKNIFSEYGMTELLSQAYSIENEIFKPSSTMKIFIRDVNDPFTFLKDNQTGGINIIDLSNIFSCCFIETKDLGKKKNNEFYVLGRFDNSDIRGCNMLIY